MRPVLRRLKSDVRAATAIEYGLIIALVALAAMGAIKAVATQNTEVWSRVSEKVTTHGPSQ